MSLKVPFIVSNGCLEPIQITYGDYNGPTMCRVPLPSMTLCKVVHEDMSFLQRDDSLVQAHRKAVVAMYESKRKKNPNQEMYGVYKIDIPSDIPKGAIFHSFFVYHNDQRMEE